MIIIIILIDHHEIISQDTVAWSQVEVTALQCQQEDQCSGCWSRDHVISAAVWMTRLDCVRYDPDHDDDHLQCVAGHQSV